MGGAPVPVPDFTNGRWIDREPYRRGMYCLEEAEKFIVENLKDEIKLASDNVGMKDYKTVLQEKLQIHGNVNIKYNIIKESGPDHDKVFVAEVLCDGKKLAEGSGKNKKMAEMDAANNALKNM